MNGLEMNATPSNQLQSADTFPNPSICLRGWNIFASNIRQQQLF